MAEWKCVQYGNTSQTGPVAAIDLVIEDLEAKGIDYFAFDYEVTQVAADAPVEVNKKEVAGKEMEVRNEEG